MSRYAANTEVGADRSRAEIERILARYRRPPRRERCSTLVSCGSRGGNTLLDVAC